MRVDPRDGVCRSCGGELVIVDADDATMQVVCMECADLLLAASSSLHPALQFGPSSTVFLASCCAAIGDTPKS